MSLDGLDTIINQLEDFTTETAAKVDTSLQTIGLLTQARSKDKSPVDTGFLKNSHYQQRYDEGSVMGVEVGVMAEYGAIVHENLGANFKRGQAKFLEAAVRETEGDHVQIFRDNLGI